MRLKQHTYVICSTALTLRNKLQVLTNHYLVNHTALQTGIQHINENLSAKNINIHEVKSRFISNQWYGDGEKGEKLE